MREKIEASMACVEESFESLGEGLSMISEV